MAGTIINPDGGPATEARIGLTWTLVKTGSSNDGFHPYGGAATDSNGHFSFEVQVGKDPVALLIFSKNEDLGSLTIVDPKANDNIQIRLGPLIKVKVSAGIDDPEVPMGTLSIDLMSPTDRGSRVYSITSTEANAEFSLPPGNYFAWLVGANAKAKRFPLIISPSVSTKDLGTFELTALPLPKLFGKPAPPLAFSAAKGLPANYKLEDSRGKWVILEFWGFW